MPRSRHGAGARHSPARRRSWRRSAGANTRRGHRRLQGPRGARRRRPFMSTTPVSTNRAAAAGTRPARWPPAAPGAGPRAPLRRGAPPSAAGPWRGDAPSAAPRPTRAPAPPHGPRRRKSSPLGRELAEEPAYALSASRNHADSASRSGTRATSRPQILGGRAHGGPLPQASVRTSRPAGRALDTNQLVRQDAGREDARRAPTRVPRGGRRAPPGAARRGSPAAPRETPSMSAP